MTLFFENCLTIKCFVLKSNAENFNFFQFKEIKAEWDFCKAWTLLWKRGALWPREVTLLGELLGEYEA